MQLLTEYLSTNIKNNNDIDKEIGFPHSDNVDTYKEFLKKHDFKEITYTGESWSNVLTGMDKKTSSYNRSFYIEEVNENQYIAFVEKGSTIDDDHPMFVYNITKEYGYTECWDTSRNSQYTNSYTYDSFEKFKNAVNKYFEWE